MQRVVARELNPLEASVISITAFNSGTTSNVIPAEAHLMGTARTFTPATRDQYPEIIKRVAAGVGEATRTEIEVDYHFGPPPMINDDACVDTGRRAAETVFGKDHLTDWELQMGGEDFAKYPQEKCILLLGGGWPEEERQFPQHSPFFDIDESVLSLGVEYFVEYVQEYQKELS
jgi:metal-dependent amidase/aminoacylase/carboxypeptidase family protein